MALRSNAGDKPPQVGLDCPVIGLEQLRREMMASIELGAMSDSIGKQLLAQGLEQTGKSAELLDRISHAITLAFLHGCLTDSETQKARGRLMKQIKVRKLPDNAIVSGLPHKGD